MSIRTIETTLQLVERHQTGTGTPTADSITPTLLDGTLTGTVSSGPTWQLTATVDSTAPTDAGLPIAVDPRLRILGGGQLVLQSAVELKIASRPPADRSRADEFARVPSVRTLNVDTLRDLDVLDLDLAGVAAPTDAAHTDERRLYLAEITERADGTLELLAQSLDAGLMDIASHFEQAFPTPTSAGGFLNYLLLSLRLPPSPTGPLHSTQLHIAPRPAQTDAYQHAERTLEGVGLQLVAGIGHREAVTLYSSAAALNTAATELPAPTTWHLSRSRRGKWATEVVARAALATTETLATTGTDFGIPHPPGNKVAVVEAPGATTEAEAKAYGESIRWHTQIAGSELTATFGYPLKLDLLGKHVMLPLPALPRRQRATARAVTLDGVGARPAANRNFERWAAGRVTDLQIDLLDGTTTLKIEIKEA